MPHEIVAMGGPSTDDIRAPSAIDSVLAIALSTARHLILGRVVLGWVCAGLLFTLAAAEMDILALSGDSRAMEIGVATAETFGCLLAIQCVVRAMLEDRRTEMGSVVDASAAGIVGRRLGRTLGAFLAGITCCAAIVVESIAIYNLSAAEWQMSVVSSNLMTPLWLAGEIALCAAWALLASILLPATIATIAGIAAFLLGRAGDLGPVPVTLFPRPVILHGGLDVPGLCAQALAAAGVAALALALRPRYETD